MGFFGTSSPDIRVRRTGSQLKMFKSQDRRWEPVKFSKLANFEKWSLGHAQQLLIPCLCSKLTVYRWKLQCFFGQQPHHPCHWHRAGSQLKSGTNLIRTTFISACRHAHSRPSLQTKASEYCQMKFVAFPEAEFTFSMRGPPPPQGQGNPVTGTLVDDFVNTKLNYFPKTLQLNHPLIFK